MENSMRSYAPGEIIFREGDYAPCMYALVEGTVEIYVNYGKSSQKQLSTLRASERATFGEMGIVDAMPRSITAVAAEAVTVDVITRETFAEYFSSDPAVVMNIMRNVSRRIREQTEGYMEVCRAIAEAVEVEGDKEKNRWLKSAAAKLVDNYRRTAENMAEENEQYNRYILSGDAEDFYSLM